MPTTLRFDLEFLKRLLTHAVNLHKPRNVEEAALLADLRDYLMYLCLDAVDDKALAKTMVERLNMLQAWLNEKLVSSPFWPAFTPETRFYLGFLFALEQLLSLRHETALLPNERISREDFKRSWKRTAEKLGLR